MHIQFHPSHPKSSEHLIVFQAEDSDLLHGLLDKETQEHYEKLAAVQSYTAGWGQSLQITFPSSFNTKMLHIIGVGKMKAMTSKGWASLGGKIISYLKPFKVADIACYIPFSHEPSIAASLGFGMALKNYVFDRYKSEGLKKQFHTLKSVHFFGVDEAKERSFYAPYKAVQEGITYTRDLLTEPSNILTPPAFAASCKALESYGLEVEVLEEAALKKLGMGALLGVGQGSVEPSQVVIIKHHGDKSSEEYPLALVGKGVTFDSGGISIKPRVGMEMMKMDMGGAGTIAGLMKTLALRSSKANVVAVLGIVENMCSGSAQRPGDVVKSMSGKTIEIINTDAEGRLVLADVLCYAQKRFKSKTLLDLATLTGAVVVALGNEYTGLFSNDDVLCKELMESAKPTHDKLWRLPLHEAYKTYMHSAIADLKHVVHGPEAKSSMAAQFLQEFILEGTKWAHLDVAGSVWSEKATDLSPKGATGWGIASINAYIQDHFEK